MFINPLHGARWLSGAVFVLLGLLIGGAYTLAYGYIVVQTILPGPLFYLLFQQSVLTQGLPFLVVGVALLGVVGALMVFVGYPFLLKWFIRHSMTAPREPNDFPEDTLFIFLDSCMALDRCSQGMGLTLLTEIAHTLGEINPILASTYFIKLRIDDAQLEEKYLLWRAYRRGDIAYLYALWPMLSKAGTRCDLYLSSPHLTVDDKIGLLTAFMDLDALSDALDVEDAVDDVKKTLSAIRGSFLKAWLPDIMPDDDASRNSVFNLVRGLSSRPMLLLRMMQKGAGISNRLEPYCKGLAVSVMQDITDDIDQVSLLFLEICRQYSPLNGEDLKYQFMAQVRALFSPAAWLKLINFCPDYKSGTSVLLQILLEAENSTTLFNFEFWSNLGLFIPGFFTQLTQSFEQHLQAKRPPLSRQMWTELHKAIQEAGFNNNKQAQGCAKSVLNDPKLYLSLLKSSFFIKERQECVIELTGYFFRLHKKGVAERAHVITPEFLASVPAYMGRDLSTLKSFFKTFAYYAIHPPLALHLITQPGFFRTSLDAYQAAGRHDFEGYAELIGFIKHVLQSAEKHLGSTWKGRFSRDMACFSPDFYMYVLQHKTLGYKEKYALVHQLQGMRDMYYAYQDTLEPTEEVKKDENTDESPELTQRIRSIAWLVEAPQYLTAADYAALQKKNLNADEAGIFTRDSSSLLRFFSAMCKGAQFFKDKEGKEGLNTRFTVCNAIFSHAANNETKDELYTAIAESPFNLDQKERLLSTLLLHGSTYLANNEKLLTDIQSLLERKNNTDLTQSLTDKVTSWEETVNARQTEGPDLWSGSGGSPSPTEGPDLWSGSGGSPSPTEEPDLWSVDNPKV